MNVEELVKKRNMRNKNKEKEELKKYRTTCPPFLSIALSIITQNG